MTKNGICKEDIFSLMSLHFLTKIQLATLRENKMDILLKDTGGLIPSCFKKGKKQEPARIPRRGAVLFYI